MRGRWRLMKGPHCADCSPVEFLRSDGSFTEDRSEALTFKTRDDADLYRKYERVECDVAPTLL